MCLGLRVGLRSYNIGLYFIILLRVNMFSNGDVNDGLNTFKSLVDE